MERLQEGLRTEQRDNPNAEHDPVAQLVDALHDLKDFGTGWANKSGAITIPSPARIELSLPVLSHWQVMGSPGLGVALLLGRRASPSQTLDFLLKSGPGQGTLSSRPGVDELRGTEA